MYKIHIFNASAFNVRWLDHRNDQLQVFFMNQFFPLSILFGPFRIFSKIRGDIHECLSAASTTPAIKDKKF
jgi:hypothetical protein